MEDYKSKLLQVFNYAKALNEVRNPIISDIENQRWTLWLKDLPNHECIDYIDISNQVENEEEANNNDYLIKVKRPILTECPVPQEELKKYIIGNWKDVDRKVELITEVKLENGNDTEPVQISAEVKNLFESWNEERNQWLLIEKPARATMKVFQDLYKLYSEMDKESETIELVMGDGLLIWVLKNGKKINHPILIQDVELLFDSQIPEFKIVIGNKDSELYSAIWRNIDSINSTAMSQRIEEMDKNHYSIIDGNATDEFFIRLSTALASDGRFTRDVLDTSSKNEPVIMRDPVLFLRKRNQGFGIALESILEDISTNDNIPPFLKRAVGFNENIALTNSLESSSSLTTINGEDEDILFTKPSNPEQLLVAKHLERSSAVLVQGPPGTGKTHTIANLVGHLLAQGKSVLITSYSEKALNVLRDKIVEPLKPLCLPVLKDNRKTDELEKTLDAMNEKRSTINEAYLEQEITSLDIERRNLIKSLKQKRESLKKEVQNEYRDIAFNGEEYSPKEAAKYIIDNREGNDWIPSPVEIGASITLNNSEIYELYKSNEMITEEEERECKHEYPEISSIMKPEEFENLVQGYNDLIKKDLEFRNDLWSSSKEDIDALKSIFEDMINAISIVDESNSWSLEIIQDGYQLNGMREEWARLIELINNLYVESIKFKSSELEYAPSIEEELDSEETRAVLQEMYDFVKDNKKISKIKLLTKPKWNKVLSKVKVNYKEPIKVEEFQALITYVEINQMRKKVIQRWDRQVTSIGGPDTSSFGRIPDSQLKQYADHIEDRLNWHENKWRTLVDSLVCLGFNWNSFIQEDKEIYAQFSELKNLKNKVTKKFAKILEAQIDRITFKNIKNSFDKLNNIIGSYDIGLYNEMLISAVKNKDSNIYGVAYKLIYRMYECKIIKAHRKELISRLEVTAQQWANAIRFRTGKHGYNQPPGEINTAWKWRQLNDELDRRGSVSIEMLQEEIKMMETSLRNISIELADKKAWLKKIQSITLSQTQAIEGWKLTIKSIGAGTGKRVPMLRAKARELAAQCQNAVPVWIMPLSTVVENFNPKENKFDVVIIDEASQADILALTAIYMGKQVVIVGDDEQVNPLAIGTKTEDYQNLIDTYLYGIPNAHLYTPQFSIYNLASTAGFQPVCLKEHFRCVAPIIQFSNHLSYKGTIMPLRDDSNVKCKPPLVSYRVNSKETADRTNIEEAVSITSLIMSCMEQPEYENKTFGVISLLGEEQARLVEEMLQRKIDPTNYKKAKILCGTSAQFQGDERDIIFISLVNTPSYNGPLSLRNDGNQGMMKKRYNVAASRACDQLWLIHSLDPDKDLKEGDLRLRLIRHAQNPYAMDASINNLVNQTESEFEAQVIKRLRQAGFKVVPQWKVGSFRIDMVVEGAGKRLAFECDGEKYHSGDKLEEDMKRQAILERLGWTFARIRGSKFFRNPDEAMRNVFKKLEAMEIPPEALNEEIDYQNVDVDSNELLNKVKARAEEIRRKWNQNEIEVMSVTQIASAAVSLEYTKEMTQVSFETKNNSLKDKVNSTAEEFKGSKKKSVKDHHIMSKGQNGREKLLDRQDSSKTNEQIKIKNESENSELEQATIFELTDKSRNGNVNLNDLKVREIAMFLRNHGLRVIDKRVNGGCLWVVGGKDLAKLFKELSIKGTKFTYTEKGGKATGYKPSWYWKAES
jgi:very-short-patch-repair endonuclease